MNELTFKTHTLNIKNASQELINAFAHENINIKDSENENIKSVINQKNYFIYEDLFIKNSTSYIVTIDKFKQKDYTNIKKFYPEKNRFDSIDASVDDLLKYKEVLKNNIIISKSNEICISVNILNKALDDSDKSRLFVDTLILLFLANKSDYSASNLTAKFTNENNIFDIKININEDKPYNLYPIYDWIINDGKNLESYNTKLQIIRETILHKRTIANVDDILNDAKLIYNRIISQKTNEYFEQINKLKDDFITLSRNEYNILRTLNLTFFTWIGTLGLKLFEIIKNHAQDQLMHYIFLSHGIKQSLTILIFIFSLIYIFIIYSLEINHLQKEYDIIRDIYKDKLLFDNLDENKSKFDAIIKKPQIGIPQLVVFMSLLIILIIRFIISTI